MKSIITIGNKKVESKNVLFLTLVTYSLFIISEYFVHIWIMILSNY